jgi:hypothetical protein
MILQSNSKSEILAYFDEAIEKWPETKAWFNSKRADWILASLSHETSKIPITWWQLAPHHTGLCESSHFVDNEAIGRKQTLVGAVLK